MADVFDFYVKDNRTIQFNLTEPIMLEDSHVSNWVFHIPRVLNNIDMSGWAWWLVYINARGQKYSELLTLSEDSESPLEKCIATYTVDYSMSIRAGVVRFSLEAINADTSGTILNEWHTQTYQAKVQDTLQGNQVEYAETESDIISALIVTVQNKASQLVGGATPEPVSLIADMTDTSKVYLYVGSETGESTNYWYYYNGSAWVAGGLYASGITVDSVPTQGSTNAVQSGGVKSALDTLQAQIPQIDTTLSQSGQAADAKETGDEITGLKEDLNEIYVESANIYNQATDRHNTIIDSNGVIKASDTYKVSDYIYVGAGNKVTIQVVGSLTLRVFFYTTNDSSGFSRALWFTGTEYQTVRLANTESYIVIQLRENCPDFMVNIGDTLLPYAPYGGAAGTFLQSAIDDINDTISAETESVRETSVQKTLINRFDPSAISEEKYIIVSDGSLSSNDAFFASDYIYIGDLESVNVSYTHIFGWYDANKNWLGHPDTMNSGNNDLTFDIPENAVYLRFSAYNKNLSLAQIGKSVSRNNYVSYGKYTLPDLIIAKEQIVVDANGNGDYTSLTEALYEHINDGVDIEVKPGTYNIVSEYVALFGQEAVNSMADADSAIFNGFQYGAIIRNRTITFDSGSYVVCDWTGHTVDGTHRFSALRVDYNCKIIGLHLVSTATFYAIHDDYGLSVPYTVEYENCYVEGVNLTNANCIGGGCKKYSKHIIKNCYFDNHLKGSATVRYHNTNAEGSVPEIYVSNCYFNNWFTPRWYGAQTSKMKVYVNNCEARSIHKLAESSSFNVDNVDLYKWRNTETDPIT